MSKSRTVWEYQPGNETLRILDSCYLITNGFFKVNGFYPVPLGHSYKELNSVVLPPVEFNSIPRYWDRVTKINDSGFFPVVPDRDLLEATSSLVKNNFQEPDYQKTSQLWREAETEVLEEITNILRLPKNQIQKIFVYPTRFGTVSSFDIGSYPQKEFKIYLREDQDIYKIAFSLISVLTRPFVYKNLAGSWEESQIIADWVIRQSSVGKVLSKYQKSTNFNGTINCIRSKENGNLIKRSEEYCLKYKIPFRENNFTTSNGEVFVNDEKLELAQNSRQIMAKLIENKGNIVTPDDLSNVLGMEDDSFSLYAISKAVQRTRDELEKNRLSSTHIQTLRGRGYLLR